MSATDIAAIVVVALGYVISLVVLVIGIGRPLDRLEDSLGAVEANVSELSAVVKIEPDAESHNHCL